MPPTSAIFFALEIYLNVLSTEYKNKTYFHHIHSFLAQPKINVHERTDTKGIMSFLSGMLHASVHGSLRFGENNLALWIIWY